MFIADKEKRKFDPNGNAELKDHDAEPNHHVSVQDADGAAAEKLFAQLQANDGEVQIIEIGKIRQSDFLNIRDSFDEETIAELTDKLRSGAKLPPVVLMQETGTNKIIGVDFAYRLLAHRRAGRLTIEARVVGGSLRQAFLLRMMLNNSHAKSLTKREKRNNALKLLKDKKWTVCSDRELSKYCDISARTIGNLRKELSPEELSPSAENTQIRMVSRNNGRQQYAMNVGGINANRSAVGGAGGELKRTTESPAPNARPVNGSGSAEMTDGKTRDSLRADADTGRAHAPVLRRAAEINARYEVKSGDVFVLYNPEKPNLHYIVYCGDATDSKFYNIVFANRRANMLVADVPYNVNLKAGGNFAKDNAKDNANERVTLVNDNLSSEDYRAFIEQLLSAAAQPLEPGAPYFIFFGTPGIATVSHAARTHIGDVASTLVWYKRGLALSSAYFRHNHELLFFGWRRGSSLLCWDGGRSQGTVFNERFHGKSKHDLPPATHPSPKPVALIQYYMTMTLARGGIVLDPVAGSGTTLVAAYLAGRSAVGVEIVPEYAAVAVSRLETDLGLNLIRTNLSGLAAVLTALNFSAEANIAETAAEAITLAAEGRATAAND